MASAAAAEVKGDFGKSRRQLSDYVTSVLRTSERGNDRFWPSSAATNRCKIVLPPPD